MFEDWIDLASVLDDFIDAGMFPVQARGGIAYKRAKVIMAAVLAFRPELRGKVSGQALAAALRRHPRVRSYKHEGRYLYAVIERE